MVGVRLMAGAMICLVLCVSTQPHVHLIPPKEHLLNVYSFLRSKMVSGRGGNGGTFVGRLRGGGRYELDEDDPRLKRLLENQVCLYPASIECT